MSESQERRSRVVERPGAIPVLVPQEPDPERGVQVVQVPASVVSAHWWEKVGSLVLERLTEGDEVRYYARGVEVDRGEFERLLSGEQE